MGWGGGGAGAGADAQGERFADTKERIRERLGVGEKDFAKFKFSLVTATVFKQPSVIEDGECTRGGSRERRGRELAGEGRARGAGERAGKVKLEAHAAADILYDHKWSSEDAIGVDHIDRRPNKVNAERGIVMR
jgi:ubiquitin carboxyl-terminal hydrolase 7